MIDYLEKIAKEKPQNSDGGSGYSIDKTAKTVVK